MDYQNSKFSFQIASVGLKECEVQIRTSANTSRVIQDLSFQKPANILFYTQQLTVSMIAFAHLHYAQ